MTRLARDARGATVVEFAIVAPVFLMFLFLLLDGGRILFAKQSVNELASAAARCAAIKPTGCTDQTSVQSWTVSRARQRSQMALTNANVVVNMTGTCNSQPAAVVTVNAPFRRGAMALLPQSSVPTTLTSTACFPRVT